MKKAFIITSAIDVDNNSPLTYSKTRSFFSNEERFRQTIATVASVDQATDDETTIYLLDISDNWQHYRDTLAYQRNLKFISIKDQFPEIYEDAKTHPQKSRCENLILSTFLKAYAEELKQYDFFFKMSGRYLLDRSFDISVFDEQAQGKIFYKRPILNEWQDWWGYQMVDLRAVQGDNYLRQYCSVLVGWSREYHQQFIGMFDQVVNELSNPGMFHYDIETLSYFYTREWAEDIVETDWIIYGWHGPDGRFVRY